MDRCGTAALRAASIAASTPLLTSVPQLLIRSSPWDLPLSSFHGSGDASPAGESPIAAHLKFTKKTADKAVAHLTLGPPDRGGKELQLYQISCFAIRAAIQHCLYEQLGLPTPPKVFVSSNPNTTRCN